MEGADALLSVKEIHDRLSHGVIADHDDLMGMGECLNLMEQLEAAQDHGESQGQRISRIKQILNGLILEECESPATEWGELRSQLSALLGNGEKGEGDDLPRDGGEPPVFFEKEDSDILAQLAEDDPALASPGPSEPQAHEPMAIGDPELARDFIEEAREHLASIELNMISLESSPTDTEAINAVFRPFHSIKGVSGFLNLTSFHHLSHEVENLLDSARSGTLTIDEPVIDVVLNSVDVLKTLLDDLENALNGDGILPPPPPSVQPLIGKVQELQKNVKDVVQGDNQQGPKLGSILLEQGLADEGTIEEAARRSSDRGTRIGEELVAMGAVTETQLGEALKEQVQSREASSVRVDTKKLDNLVDMVGELVIAQSMVLQNEDVKQIRDQKLQKDMGQLGRITAELQRISLSMRMVPIRGTFQKLVRLVRDLGKKSGKDATLEMSGEETEIDRNMVELIYEPLVHMIRNSMDHGIELPQERLKNGKSAQGKIHLSAEQKGGNILISIVDDGRGLDVEKIRQRALDREIISANDKLDDRAVYELIFHPGFSTKDAVTEVSGRGVGMDVVKKSVERLRGKIEISSSLGHGSHFSLKLPLTMAIIDGMVIRVGEERFVVPTIALKESLRPEEDSLFTVQGKGEMIQVRETLMPLIRLHSVFHVEPRSSSPWEGLLLVVHDDNRSYSLLADEIVGRQEVVIKNLGSSLRNLKGISGGAILGDGRVALILDVKGMVSLYEEGTQ